MGAMPSGVRNLFRAALVILVISFVIGILTESSTLKRIFTPILGLALLYGIYSYLTASESEVDVMAP